jgi:hypothetical protein
LAALNTRLRKSVTPQESNLAALLFALGRSTSSLHCPTHCVVFALHEWTWVKSPNSTWNNVGSFVEISVGRNTAAQNLKLGALIRQLQFTRLTE